MNQRKQAELWDRQDGESSKAYEAFCTYRDLGPNRSIAKAGQTMGKNKVTLEQWSRKFNWVKRVAAWEVEQDRIAREEQISEIKKMRRRHAKLASDMLQKAGRALQNISEDEIKAADISRLVETASKLERLARGDVGDVLEQRDGGESISMVQFYLPQNGRDQDKEGDER